MYVLLYLLVKWKKWHWKMDKWTINHKYRFLKQKERAEFLKPRHEQITPPPLFYCDTHAHRVI